MNSTIRWLGLALLGVLIAAGVSIAASRLASQQIGLASQPISAGDALVPRASPRPRRPGGRTPAKPRHTVPTPPTTSTQTASPPATVPASPPTPSGPSRSGGGEGDHGGGGRGGGHADD
jgi:hypothetical protein